MGNRAADAEAKKGVLLHPDNGLLVEQANQLRTDQAELCQYFAYLNERLQRDALSDHLCAALTPASEALLASRGAPLRAGGPTVDGERNLAEAPPTSSGAPPRVGGPTLAMPPAIVETLPLGDGAPPRVGGPPFGRWGTSASGKWGTGYST